MSHNIDSDMRTIIEGWGIPNIPELSNRNIEFVFDSKKISNVGKYYENLVCEHNNVKFCLYDIDSEEIVFSMDFFASNNSWLAFTGEKPSIKLELLNVNDHKLRNKGIASYYLEKLQKYARNNNFSYIKVVACPSADIFEGQNTQNRLEKDDLKEFYMRKSTEDMPIKLIDL